MPPAYPMHTPASEEHNSGIPRERLPQEETKLGNRFRAEWETRWRYDPAFVSVQLAAQLPAEVPGLLWVFGEHGQSVVMVATENQVFPHHAFIPSVESQARINEASRLFPEAHIAKIEEEFWKANQ